jgi:asparagine synthase (glutamine-hydrolysing)
MCGSVGTWGQTSGTEDTLRSAIRRLAHRGPEDTGIWMDANCGIAVGHTRLAILDLSAAGHEPMLSACGRYVISFNGEIYNHLKLRTALFPNSAPASEGKTLSWRGHLDTETLLACIAAWGIERTLKAAVGMSPFAL